MKCSFLGYVQLLMIGQAILAKKVNQNVKKGPQSHQKMKCSFLDYIQLLMISGAIQAMKVDKNAPLKCLRMTWNGQFHQIHNFSNLFPPKWLRMTQNGQFCMAKKKHYDTREFL